MMLEMVIEKKLWPTNIILTIPISSALRLHWGPHSCKVYLGHLQHLKTFIGGSLEMVRILPSGMTFGWGTVP